MEFFNDTLSELWFAILNFLYVLVEFLFSWINLPDFPVSLQNSIDVFLSLIFDNLSLLGFFIRGSTLKLVIPILIILINFEFIYRLIMWLVKKLPFVNLK